MRYFSFVKTAENQPAPPPVMMEAMQKFIQTSLENGSLVQTGGLGGSSTAFRIRLSGGKLNVTDGPFTEAKELIGGYALLEAKSREAVIEVSLAFMRLHKEYWPEWEGECEVRELMFLAP